MTSFASEAFVYIQHDKPSNGGVITTVSGGKTTTVSTDEYVVVRKRKGPRKPKPTPKPLAKVDCTPKDVPVTVTKQETVPKEVRRNRISLVGGYGTQYGINGNYSPDLIEMETKVGLVGGLQYQRLLPLLNDRLSVGLQVQSNRTSSLLVGFDF